MIRLTWPALMRIECSSFPVFGSLMGNRKGRTSSRRAIRSACNAGGYILNLYKPSSDQHFLFFPRSDVSTNGKDESTYASLQTASNNGKRSRKSSYVGSPPD